MKTKIIHYGTDDETYILTGAYDSHTDEAGQGVYGKREMLEFVRIVTEHFLTPRQRYFYFQCVVYGKKVEDIAGRGRRLHRLQALEVGKAKNRQR